MNASSGRGASPYYLFFLLSICSCTARADFAGDSETLALLLGFAETGGCAEIESNTAPPYYDTRIWGLPSRLCNVENKGGNSYAEYLELARSEYVLIGQVAERYAGDSCSAEVSAVQAFPLDPALSQPVSMDVLKDDIDYDSTQWVPVADPINEARNFLKDEWAMSDAYIAASSATSYAEYISLLAGVYIIEMASGNPACETQAQAMINSFHPGWIANEIGDASVPIKKVVLSECYYGPSPPSTTRLCSTLGPEF